MAWSKNFRGHQAPSQSTLESHTPKGVWVSQDIAGWELYVSGQIKYYMDAKFIKHLIKGKIAEIIFEQMFRESGKYTILHSGYEYTLPELAQYQHLTEVKAVIENIKNAPDFVLISQDKKEVHLVEVKYRDPRRPEDLKEIVGKTLEIWNPSWLFVASPDGFFFEPCNTVLRNNGNIERMYARWVDPKIQEEYLKLLNQFELKG
ncbi:MAG: Uncharacterized protein LiPW15_91 [Parcubacteria group bacterium LiPW_15]|nr:MAG: Uncharacterized protein LiPW15_91 [Parcubacteria group bacterium LiPW_15]